MKKIKIYTDESKTEYAVCVSGDKVMRAETVSGIRYPRLVGTYSLRWDSAIDVLPKSAVDALGMRIENVESSDLYTNVCGICGKKTHSEWVELFLCVDEHLIAGHLESDEITQIGQVHYDCEEEA